MPTPKKPRKSRPKKVNLSIKAIWEKIVLEVEKQEVPINVLDRIVIFLADGTSVEINVKQLLSDGTDPNELEEHLNRRLKDLEEIITDVDYFIDIDSVVKTVQPETDRILRDL